MLWSLNTGSTAIKTIAIIARMILHIRILDVAFVTLLKIQIDVHRITTLAPLDAIFMVASHVGGFGSEFFGMEIGSRIQCEPSTSK